MDYAEKITVSKLEAAHRQLDCAIEMWFAERDEVSVHTLVAAAHQIIHDICQKRGIKGETIFDSKFIKPEARKRWAELVREAMNFFKHADKDPEGSLEFASFTNPFFMMMSMLGLELLGEPKSWQLQAFQSWVVFNLPEMLSAEYIESLTKTFGVENYEYARTIERHKFLEAFAVGRLKLGLFTRNERVLISRPVIRL